MERRLRDESQELPVVLEPMVFQSLHHSPQVQVIQLAPAIAEKSIMQEQAAFDWTTFADSKYVSLNDPVGNTLTTGGPLRFHNQNWIGNAGVRKLTENGGRAELIQQLGYQDSNSLYFTPRPQGNTRLEMRFTQPLLNGAGRLQNTSLIAIAKIDSRTAMDEVSIQLQDHLLELTRSHWNLYRARCLYVQRMRLLVRADGILETLVARHQVDTLYQQTLRARVAVGSRQALVERTAADILNAESRVKFLVNDPDFRGVSNLELIPRDMPRSDYAPLSKEECLRIAVDYRPEIARASKVVESASVRLGVAENEVKPKLDLVLSTYVAGLAGDSNISEAYQNQFSRGGPGFTGGLVFEVPLGNRAAKAYRDQRQLELSRAVFALQSAVDLGRTETEIAVQEIEAAYQQLQTSQKTMLAAEKEVDYLTDRWHHLAGTAQTTSLLLEDLLDSQQRLAEQEEAFVTAQVNYVLAHCELQRSMGTLLSMSQSGTPGGSAAPEMEELPTPQSIAE